MTTMSAAFCVKAPVATKASAKVRVLAARLTPRCRAARRRHRNFFRSRKRRPNAGPVADHPSPVPTSGCVRRPRQGVQGLRFLRQGGPPHRCRRHVRRHRRHHREDEGPYRECSLDTLSLGFRFRARSGRRRATARATATQRTTAESARRVVFPRTRRPAVVAARRAAPNAPVSRRTPGDAHASAEPQPSNPEKALYPARPSATASPERDARGPFDRAITGPRAMC